MLFNDYFHNGGVNYKTNHFNNLEPKIIGKNI